MLWVECSIHRYYDQIQYIAGPGLAIDKDTAGNVWIVTEGITGNLWTKSDLYRAKNNKVRVLLWGNYPRSQYLVQYREQTYHPLTWSILIRLHTCFGFQLNVLCCRAGPSLIDVDLHITEIGYVVSGVLNTPLLWPNSIHCRAWTGHW